MTTERVDERYSPVSWLKVVRKDFEDFPQGAQIAMARALTILAEGRMA
jgi:hypothetical protein